MTAKEYEAERGAAVSDWLTAHIESQFGRVVEGEKAYKSQFDIPYMEYTTTLDTRQGHEGMMRLLTLFTDQSLPQGDLKGMTLVWRVRPTVYAVSPDFAANESFPYTIKVRYRMHTMEGVEQS